MNIERFFGKGRAAEAKPRAKEETKPRRPQGTTAEADAKAMRPAPANATIRSGGEPSMVKAAPASPMAAVSDSPPASSPPTYEEIAARAYDLWQEQGRPEGRERENWIEAERQLAAERTGG